MELTLEDFKNIKEIHIIKQDITNKKYGSMILTIGNTCQYNCSYCVPSLKSGTVPHISINVYKDFISWFKNKFVDIKNIDYVVLCLIGGEPTIYPYFEELVSFIRNTIGNDEKMFFTMQSNGAKSKSFFSNIEKYFTQIQFTYHPEFANDNKFINNCLLLHDTHKLKIKVSIAIPSNEEHFKKSVNMLKTLREYGLINVNFKVLYENDFRTLQKYSEEQKQIMNYFIVKNHNDPKLNHKIIFKDGTEKIIHSQYMPFHNLNHYSGWLCNAGVYNLHVHHNGTVTRCSGNQKFNTDKEKIGSIFNIESLKYFETSKPDICNIKSCVGYMEQACKKIRLETTPDYPLIF